MSTLNLYKGGRPAQVFPGCASEHDFVLPYPMTIAGEYGRGDFTLGDSIHAAYRPYQQHVMADVTPGDTVNLLAVPGEHSVTALFVKIEPVAPMLAPGCSSVGCIANSMDGVTLDVVAHLYDENDDARTQPPQSALALPAGFSGLDASVEQSAHAFMQEYVPAGSVMLLGLRFLSAPVTAGVTFADLAGRISLVVKAHDYQYPWQQ